MSTTKEQFIGRISRALGRQSVPTQLDDAFDYTTGPQYARHRGLDAAGLRDVLAGQQKIRDFTMVTCDKATLADAVAAIVEKEAPNRIVVPKDSAADGLDLMALAASTGAEVYGYDKNADAVSQRAIIESTDLGITIPVRAIADTGTTLELADSRAGKIVTLLPPAHISIIFQSRLEATLTDVAPMLDAMAEADALPSYFLFVSGPSSTGDIESIMVTGVHGPTREYYIVVTDL